MLLPKLHISLYFEDCLKSNGQLDTNTTHKVVHYHSYLYTTTKRPSKKVISMSDPILWTPFRFKPRHRSHSVRHVQKYI